MPPMLLDYIDAMCLRRARQNGASTYHVGSLLIALLRKVDDTSQQASTPASSLTYTFPCSIDQDTFQVLCEQILHALGVNSPWENEELSGVLQDSISFLQFWRMALHLIQDVEAAGAELFTLLVSTTVRDSWPEIESDAPHLPSVLHAIHILLTRFDAVSSPSPRAKATLQSLNALKNGLTTPLNDDLFGEQQPAASVPSLWASRAFFSYAVSLQLVWRQVESSGGRRPVLPPPVFPEPETILLVHGLCAPNLNWYQKCLEALGILKTRLHYSNEPSNDICCAYLMEIFVAITHAAIVQLKRHPTERHAQVWRHVIGGLLPPLALFLGGSVPASNNDVLNVQDTVSSFIAFYEPVNDWMHLDAQIMAPSHAATLPDLMQDSFAAWLPGHSKKTTSIELENLHQYASSSVQSFRQIVHTSLLHNPSACGNLIERAVKEPCLQLVLAMELNHLLSEWTEFMSAEFMHMHAICYLLQSGAPQNLDMLCLYMGQQLLPHTLVHVLSHMDQSMWSHPDDALNLVILFVEYLSYYSKESGNPSKGAAYVFMRRRLSCFNSHALPEEYLTLLSRWCRCLVGSDDMSELLTASPPWLLFRLTPSIFKLLIEAFLHGFFDESTLLNAFAYFLRVPLRYNVPCAVNWLVRYTTMTLAKAQYEPKLWSLIFLLVRTLHMLFMSDACPPLIRSMLAGVVLPLLQNERLVLMTHTSNVNIPLFISTLQSYTDPHLPQSPWIVDVLMMCEDAKPWYSLVQRIGIITLQGLDTCIARQLLGVALQTRAEQVWTIKLLAAVFSLLHLNSKATKPLSLVRVILLQWDASSSKPEHIRNLGRILVLSVLLSKNLPASADALETVFGSLLTPSAEPLAHILRSETYSLL